MTGPGWLTAGLAGLMLLVAGTCAVRLVIWWRHGRGTEPDADGVHVVMGVAMAGMLEPQLSPLPDAVWRVIFVAAAAWFGWQSARAWSRRRSSRARCAHPVPHAVECAAMLYMLLPTRSAGRSAELAMPGMGAAAGTGNPALALVLALFMVGYILWTTDHLAALSRLKVVEASHRSSAEADGVRASAVGGAFAAPAGQALAPRLAACYKIVMSLAMGYMLIMMAA
jgi:Domain of unknown function (DUF5134)